MPYVSGYQMSWYERWCKYAVQYCCSLVYCVTELRAIRTWRGNSSVVSYSKGQLRQSGFFCILKVLHYKRYGERGGQTVKSGACCSGEPLREGEAQNTAITTLTLLLMLPVVVALHPHCTFSFSNIVERQAYGRNKSGPSIIRIQVKQKKYA